MKLDASTEIIKCKMVNVDDGTEELLFEEEDSSCHFRKKIEFDKHILHLRLDWGDIKNGEPTLDADIWLKPKCGKNRLRNGKWHHTSKEFDTENGWVYNFKFQNLKLTLQTIKTITKKVCSTACISDSIDIQLND